MKTLLILFVLLFSSSVVAEDISDFQIEGMSVGDSLLDYVSEEYIFREFEIGKDEYNWTDQKFADVYIYDNLNVYKRVSASVKKNDKKYIIYDLRGQLDFKNINDCFDKQKEISLEFEKMINNENVNKIEDNYAHATDKSGKSMVYEIGFYFLSRDKITTKCYDFSNTLSQPDGLDIEIQFKEFGDWIRSF